MQLPQGIHTGDGATEQPGHPAPIRPLGKLLLIGQLDDAQQIEHGDVIDGQVSGIPQLATDGEVVDDGISGVFVVEGHRGGLEVFDELRQTEDLSGGAEFFLDRLEDVDGALRVVGAQEVPGVEAGEVLDRSEHLVPSGGGRDIAQVMRYGGVVDQCAGDHFHNQTSSTRRGTVRWGMDKRRKRRWMDGYFLNRATLL